MYTVQVQIKLMNCELMLAEIYPCFPQNIFTSQGIVTSYPCTIILQSRSQMMDSIYFIRAME